MPVVLIRGVIGMTVVRISVSDVIGTTVVRIASAMNL